ncbi:hypothetical protein PFISCL1PPCAC_5536, partial [Pristionchus fissidentatus]
SNSSPLSSSSPLRSHALFLFVLLVLLDLTIATPYYERDWRGDDDVPVFEADSSSSGSLASSSVPSSISIPNPRAETGIETTTDRSIRPTTLTSLLTVPSPHLVPAQSTLPPPTVTSTDLSTTVSEPEPHSGLEQNTRMMEIVANLTRKLNIKTSDGSGSDTSITFTPDELQKLKEIIGVTDFNMKANFDTKRRQLLISNGPVKSISEQYEFFPKQVKSDEPEEEELDEMEVSPVPSPTPIINTTVIVETTTQDVEELEDFEPDSDSSNPHAAGIDEQEMVRPALCDLNTDDEAMTIIWSLIQSRIREWGYGREQSTVLALVTFGLLLDSKEVVIPMEESNLWNDAVAAIHCLFRSCELAMPNRQFEQRVVKVPEIPRRKREPLEFESSLFECRCPRGYVFA